MQINIWYFFALSQYFFNNFFDVFLFVVRGDCNNKSHLEFALRSLISFSTIILTSCVNPTEGLHPKTFLAFDESPIKKSTSAGLNSCFDTCMYFFQFLTPITPKASSTKSATE